MYLKKFEVRATTGYHISSCLLSACFMIIIAIKTPEHQPTGA